MSAPLRRGFSLFQLLVVLALLVILFGVAFPAILRARKMALYNNLRELGLATQNYQSAFGRLPPGVDANNFSVSAYLLPYLEQDNLFAMIDFKKPITDEQNVKLAKMRVPTYLSPFDSRKTVNEYGATSYLFSAGSKPDLVDNDGVFYRNSKTTLAQIPDGTSNTLLFGETLLGDGGTKAEDVKRQHVKLGKDALKGLTDDSGLQEWKDNKAIAGDRGASWMDGRFLQGTFTATRVPNDPKPDVSCDGLGGLSALRGVGDTVNVVMCDGSYRVIKASKITPALWKALATRAGGEIVPNDF